MRVFIPVLVCAMLMCAQSASAESSHNAKAQKSDANHSATFIKPGAAVALSHDYDGDTNLGELETLTVSLSHIYQDGTLSVALLVPDEVQISAFTPIRDMPVDIGSTLDFSIQFSGLKQGHFAISLETVFKDSEGHESRRILSVPVTFGGKIFEKSRVPFKADINTVSKVGLIGLPAIETIE